MADTSISLDDLRDVANKVAGSTAVWLMKSVDLATRAFLYQRQVNQSQRRHLLLRRENFYRHVLNGAYIDNVCPMLLQCTR